MTTHFSLVDFIPPSCEFLAVENVLNQVHYDMKILPDAISRLEHIIITIVYRFILDSDNLFHIKPGKEMLCEMIKEYAEERERRYCQVLDSDLFVDPSVEVFDSASTTSSSESKKRKINEKTYTLNNYFQTLCKKYLPGEVAKHAHNEAVKFVKKKKEEQSKPQQVSRKKQSQDDTIIQTDAFPVVGQYEQLMELILKNFDCNTAVLVEEDRSVELVFVGLTAITDYLIAEVVELAGNASRDNMSAVIAVNSLRMAITFDDELKLLMSGLMHVSPFDLSFLYGWDTEELPSVTVSTNKVGAFHVLPHELHATVLKFFDDAHELMSMRVICKFWNYLILKDQDIWKNLTFHSLIRENIFTTIDSSFTMEEMETILSNSTSSPNNRKSIHVKMIKHFMENNNWFNINYLLVRKNMMTLNFIRRKMKKYNIMQDSAEFRLAVYGQTNHLVTDPMEIIGTSKSGGNPHIHKSKMEDFTKLSEKFEFIGQINCKELSPFLSARLLPKTGMIYFFIEGVSCLQQQALVLYHDCDTEHLIELKDTKFKTSTMEMLVSLTEGPLFSSSSDEFEEESFERIGNLLSVTTQRDTSFCGAISSSVLNNASFRPQAKQDEVVLFSTFISGDNQYEVISFMIGSDMLRKRRFSEARCQSH